MNTKVLIQTLTELPDLELLKQLQTILKDNKVAIPDLNKLFSMFASIFKCRQKDILIRGMLLLTHVTSNLLDTEFQICWRCVGGETVRLCGQQDQEIRKKGRQILFYLLGVSHHAVLFLQTLYHEGLQSESTLVISNSIQLIQKIFQQHPNLLQHKSNIPIIKLILQKIIRFTFKEQQHQNIHKKSVQFMQALFYMNFSNLDEVLQRMDEAYIKILQKLWSKNKQQLLYKYKESQQKITSIQYQHLPIIHDKIFGIYQPFVIKNLFTPSGQSALQYSLQQFHRLFLQNQQVLTKFVNPITKIIIRLIPDKHTSIVEMLNRILAIQGISNIINLKALLDVLMPQLAESNVNYRKLVRQCFQKLNYSARGIVQFYNQKLQQIGKNNEEYDWIQVYQILQLTLHWISVSQPGDCYPPTLNKSILFCFQKRATKIPKIRQKCRQYLFYLLQKYPSYRQTLQQKLTQRQMQQLQDNIQANKNYVKLNEQHKKDAKQTFVQEYNEQRNRYLKERNNYY